MGLIAIFLQTAFRVQGVFSSQPHTNALPKTVTGALEAFALEGRTVTYAVCPACHCTYKPSADPNVTTYPRACTNQRLPERLCGASLVKTLPDGRLRPIKIFVYHSFHDFLARLLARPDLEAIMDQRCDDLADIIAMGRQASQTDSSGDQIMNGDCQNNESEKRNSDVFGAKFMKTFRDHTKEFFFVERPNDEGRYVFSMNVDFFNPEGMSVRGPSISSRIISMACLNLPLNIRHKPENMYVAGIIPGPKEPRMTGLNHYLRPLIDDLVVSWQRGVKFSRTSLHPNGRVTRSAIAACVCDLPAARKAAQLASARSHHYCSICQCFHLSTLGRTDIDDWVPRDPQELRRQAERWRNATTVLAQEKLFEEHGVRWSELWRLDYWDPTRQLVVDSMHCLLEGLVDNHVRVLLGLTTAKSSASQKGREPPAFTHQFKQYDDEFSGADEKTRRHVSQIHELLTRPIHINGKLPAFGESVGNDKQHAESSNDDARSNTDAASNADARSTTDTTSTDEPSTCANASAPSDPFQLLRARLADKRRPALEFVCQWELPASAFPTTLGRITKALFADALVEWVSERCSVYF
jgi:hypothetical protein